MQFLNKAVMGKRLRLNSAVTRAIVGEAPGHEARARHESLVPNMVSQMMSIPETTENGAKDQKETAKPQ